MHASMFIFLFPTNPFPFNNIMSYPFGLIHYNSNQPQTTVKLTLTRDIRQTTKVCQIPIQCKRIQPEKPRATDRMTPTIYSITTDIPQCSNSELDSVSCVPTCTAWVCHTFRRLPVRYRRTDPQNLFYSPAPCTQKQDFSTGQFGQRWLTRYGAPKKT